MRGGLRSACSLMIVLALAGCAGNSWQFWKTSESREAPADPTLASTPPAEVTPTPAPTTVATATPASVETPVVLAPSSNGFAELPGLPEVRFRAGQVTLAKADIRTLDSVLRWIKQHPEAQVLVEGHTDDLGTHEENRIVGEKRATSIMRYLTSKGVEPARISIVSVGSERPLCAEKTDACRAKNRRARFLVKQP